MRVDFSEQATTALIEIGDYIARDSPSRAFTLMRALRLKAAELGNKPLAFPLSQRHKHKGIRRRLFRGFLIFYRIEDDRVLVIHIVHSARDYDALLSPSQQDDGDV